MRRIVQPGQAEQTINKSRFAGYVEACANEREVADLFRRLAAEHPGAHHLAFAYRLKTPQGLLQRSHDAGEPSGTAGKPILQHLEGKDLVNACIAVVRYYGGINLGTGGLARAYGNTARMALAAARLDTYVEMAKLRLVVDYGRWECLAREVERMGGRVLDKDFGSRVTVLAEAPESETETLRGRFSDE